MMEAASQANSLQPDLDSLSLQQALVDFEIANARVLDLTRRLMESQAENTELRMELQRVRQEREELERVHQAMMSSHAFRWANKLWALRNVVGI